MVVLSDDGFPRVALRPEPVGSVEAVAFNGLEEREIENLAGVLAYCSAKTLQAALRGAHDGNLETLLMKGAFELTRGCEPEVQFHLLVPDPRRLVTKIDLKEDRVDGPGEIQLGVAVRRQGKRGRDALVEAYETDEVRAHTTLHGDPAPIHSQLVLDEGVADQQLVVRALELPRALATDDESAFWSDSVERFPASCNRANEISIEESRSMQPGKPVVGSGDGTEVEELLNLLAVEQLGLGKIREKLAVAGGDENA